VRPSPETFRAQADLVEKYADLREDRASEILAQIGMQTDFWATIAFLHPARTPKTLEVLGAALRLAIAVEMRFKHALACPRPHEYSPQIQPMIQTPGHGSLPSGHSTQAYIIAEVYWAVLPAARRNALLREQLMRQAARVAINRHVAGVHFPVDSAAGRVLGTTLAGYFVARATKGKFAPRRFRGDRFDRRADFEPRHALDGGGEGELPAYVEVLEEVAAAPCEALDWLWDEAQKEWRS
jgi:membrane-associated phospholipid phosphatase